MRVLLAVLMLIPSVALADITVGAGANYESFTDAVYQTVDSGETIIVLPGEYDIRQEYETAFPDQVPEQFQRGVYLHDREVRFLPGAKLTCVWDRDDGFSPLYIDGGVILDGLNLYAEGTLYAIHDDPWHREEPYVNEYRHCRIVGRLLKNANCIGGGAARNARILMENCWLDNGVAGSLTVRYHNTDLDGAEGDIWISNSWFNGYLGLCCYGETSHLDVYMNGCRAERIETRKETEDSAVRNIDLYAWNNETAP